MLEIKKVWYRNQCYTPVFRGSQMLSLEELETLASEPVEDAPERLAKCILITNETMKDGRTLPPVRNYDVPEDIRLVLGDIHLPVAMIEDVESVDDNTIGPHLRAVARFSATRLGEICYHGMVSGVLGGVCAVILFGERRGIELGIIQEVRLGAIEDSCLPSAKIWPVSKNHASEEKGLNVKCHRLETCHLSS